MYLKSKDGVCLLLASAHYPTKPACLTFSCQTCKVVLPRSILTSETHVVMPTAGSAENLTPPRSSPPIRADGKGDKYPSFLASLVELLKACSILFPHTCTVELSFIFPQW